jgi:hypothetical protein
MDPEPLELWAVKSSQVESTDVTNFIVKVEIPRIWNINQSLVNVHVCEDYYRP